MAIALDGSAISGSITTGDTLTLPSWTPTANNPVLLAIAQRNETIAISVAGNSLTWTSIANVDNTQNEGGIALWRGRGASPTTGSITITVTGNLLPVVGIAQQFSGVDTTTDDGVEAFATNAGPAVDDNDMLQAVTTISDNAWAVAGGWHRGNVNLTVPAGETAILVNVRAGTGGNITNADLWYQGPVTPPASTQLGDLNDLSAAVDWAMIVVSLKPSALFPDELLIGRRLMSVP